MTFLATWPEFWQAMAQFAIGTFIVAAVLLPIAAFVKWLITHH